MRSKIKILIVVVFLVLPFCGGAFSAEKIDFFVDPSYDKYGRSEIEVHLQRITNNIYFYVDSSWWETLSEEKKREYDDAIYKLGSAFERDIYRQITSVFGSEPEHNVSKDDRISVLFHEMRDGAGGYFNSADQYSVHQIKRSNEKNLLYMSAKKIESPLLSSFLGHEFMHLVTFAQKNRQHGVTEEIWLNELRSEMMPTFLGYDKSYEGSNLQMRVETFLRDPDISLTEWTNQGADYGVANIFGQYLVDHYGIELLVKSLESEFVGIPSIEYALRSLGYNKTFSDVFVDWMVAVYVNDCSLGKYYCYKSKDLSNLKVRPTTNFLPFTDKGSLTVSYNTKNWSGNWHRIVGGQGTLSLKFIVDKGRNFKVPYLLCDNGDSCVLDFMEINNQGEGSITVKDFNVEYSSLTIMPSIQGKIQGFNGPEPSYLFSWEAEIKRELKEGEKEEKLRDLLNQLRIVEEQLARLRARIAGQAVGDLSCSVIRNSLSFGIMNSREVACLQQFLKSQGVYPEGIISGNFLTLTKNAVVRFQEKYKSEILSPLGLEEGTGYVGPSTRSFINKIIFK